MAEVTEVLERVNRGEAGAYDELIPLVYEELRRKARLALSPAAAVGHTLQPTALVHEAFAKLVGAGPGRPHWQTSRHFYNAAAEVMRQILVDHARTKGRRKRGGGLRRVDLSDVEVTADQGAGEDDVDWEALDRALSKLHKRDERRYRVVMLRYFAGLSDEQIGAALGISDKTVQRDWKAARLYLMAEMDAAVP